MNLTVSKFPDSLGEQEHPGYYIIFEALKKIWTKNVRNYPKFENVAFDTKNMAQIPVR